MRFIDQAEIKVQGGDGGDGMVAFRREKYVPAGGPAGGNGGSGGSVILRAETNLQTLLDFQYARIFQADNGQRGGPKNRTGASGQNRIVDVPCGTMVYDADTNEVIGDLTHHDQRLTVALGGKGGLGNKHFLSNRNRAPEQALPGLPGEERSLRLELKLLAEVGIIGVPNAGKSTLISVLSAARPKIADYPFTTLIPNLGVVPHPSGDGVVFADIPGLIQGAHEGAGLGHDFLRHVERTRILVHLVDVTDDTFLENYTIIQSELQAYQSDLSLRPQLLVLNKCEALSTEYLGKRQQALEQVAGQSAIRISAVTKVGLEVLLEKIWQNLERMRAET